jgi:hypothetical protein
VPLQLPSAALVHAAKMVLLEMPAQFDVSGDMGAVGRLERAGPALQEQVSLEEAAAAGAGAAAGGGAGGNHNARSAAGDLQGAKPVHLDLKGERSSSALWSMALFMSTVSRHSHLVAGWCTPSVASVQLGMRICGACVQPRAPCL